MANEGRVRRVEIDHNRFRQIVRGRIKKDLHRFITQGEFLTRKGRDVVSVPLPQIRLPQFRFGRNESGVGMGEGDPGTPLEGDAGSSGGGPGGDQAGEHVLEVEVSLDDLAKILGEELELPRIEPRGTRRFSAVRDRYTGLRRVGPESLRHFKRTFKESLKRQMIQGTYDPVSPRIVPVRDDRRYRSWNMRLNPESNAVIIYMMDVSGSMGSEQKEIVRIEAFWIDTWLRSQYRNLEVRYIVHDAVAKEVDQHTFYHLRESGGTKISSAYELCTKVIEERYPPSEWNIYPFHFSDGDNWSGKDTEKCVKLLEGELLPRVNMFGYGQVKSAYGTGQFKGDLDEHFKGDERLVTSDIQSRESILDSIREFLGKGR
jgi:sporulation protein YhbH